MGEYAKRRSDGEEIKIGTCESMYYIRYEDRHMVEQLPGSLDAGREMNLHWRLPFPDEDDVNIGEYADHDRAVELVRRVESENGGIRLEYFKFDDLEAEDTGTFYIWHDAHAVRVKVNCWHGQKVPESSADLDFEYVHGNIHPTYEMPRIKNDENEGIRAIVRCKNCHRMWRVPMEEVLPYVKDEVLRARLAAYME